MITRALALALTAAALMSCGYALVGKGSNIPEEIEAVYVEPLENRTGRSQVEQILTRAIVDELVTRRRFSVAGGSAEADAQLSGAVVGFAVIPVTFDAEGRATEYEISITAAVEFRQLDIDEVLWSNDRYLFKSTYVIDPDEATYFDRENIAIAEASLIFAKTMVSDLLEGF